MVDRRVTEDTAILGAAVASGDLFDVVDVSDSTDAATGTNKKITASEMAVAVTSLGALATDAELAAHVSDATAAHAASAISFTPTGSISSTDVQAAIAEAASESGGTAAPGRIAPYIGSYDNSHAYAVGDVVDYWTGAAYNLYQASAASTGNVPTDVTHWSQVTVPIALYGTVNPVLAHRTDVHGVGIGGTPGNGTNGVPHGTTYQYVNNDATTAMSLFIFILNGAGWETWWAVTGQFIDGSDPVPPWIVGGIHGIESDSDAACDVYAYPAGAFRYGSGVGIAVANLSANRAGSGTGGASVLIHADVVDTAVGDADARAKAEVLNTATGSAVSGSAAVHHSGGEAHIYPRATSSEAYIDVQGSFQTVGAIESNVNTVAATGSTETLDTAVYAVHDCTMDQNCTFTFSNPAPSGKNSTFMLILRGAFTPTLPGSVKWSGGSVPTYTTPSLYVFTTIDAGTTWLGQQVGRAFA